jgi:hypothetical protein
MLEWFMTRIAVVSVAALTALSFARGGPAAAKQESLERPRDPSLARAIKKICRTGGCQQNPALTDVRVWRDKKATARVLVYRSTGCHDVLVTYHDVSGRLLVTEQTGPREPDEWNSPDDRKIDKLLSGLTAAESYPCHGIPPITDK